MESCKTKYLLMSYTFLIETVTCFTHKVKSFLSHVHPDNVLSPQLRVNRGELSPKSFVVDHILDSLAQLFSSHVSSAQDRFNSKFALVALSRAPSAKLKNLDEHINMVFEATESILVKEEQALNKECQALVFFVGSPTLCLHRVIVMQENDIQYQLL